MFYIVSSGPNKQGDRIRIRKRVQNEAFWTDAEQTAHCGDPDGCPCRKELTQTYLLSVPLLIPVGRHTGFLTVADMIFFKRLRWPEFSWTCCLGPD